VVQQQPQPEAGRDIKTISRSRFDGAGRWFNFKTISSILSHHPVSGHKVAIASFS